jgi:uncharacterized repeat protein (TIGR03847 family)
MPEPRAFGAVIYIAAEAIGQPGQRRFRLRAMNADGETATLWLEKEQLTALGEAIENVLKDENFQYRGTPMDDADEPPVMPLNTDVDIRLAQLSMGIDRDSRVMVLMGADGPEVAEDRTAVNMTFDYRRGHELQMQISQVVAAGRPPCPLCTAPMDPAGHVCVRTNGHHPH